MIEDIFPGNSTWRKDPLLWGWSDNVTEWGFPNHHCLKADREAPDSGLVSQEAGKDPLRRAFLTVLQGEGGADGNKDCA